MGYDVHQSIGDHDVTVESVELIDREGDAVNLVIACRLKFSDGEIGNKDLYPTKSDKSAAIARKSLKAMGFDPDTRSLDELSDGTNPCKGAKVRVSVEENEWNGKINNRIAWINAIPKPPTKAGISRLANALKNAKNDNAVEEL